MDPNTARISGYDIKSYAGLAAGMSLGPTNEVSFASRGISAEI